MRFDELNEGNFILFAIKNYRNSQALTREDFEKDLITFIEQHWCCCIPKYIIKNYKMINQKL